MLKFLQKFILNFEQNFLYFLLVIGFLIVMIGFLGIVFSNSNLIRILVGIELMLLGCSISFAVSSWLLGDSQGFLIMIALICIAASESAVGLGLVIQRYKLRKTVYIYNSHILQG